MNHEIIDAINNKNLIEFNYDGEYRLVEPHTYGVSKKENELLRVYQIDGESTKGKVPDWKLFSVDKIENLQIVDETFDSPRPGYQKSDSAMKQIFAEL